MIIDDLAPLYRQPLHGGVCRLDQLERSDDATAVADRLTDAGWQTSILGAISDLDGFYTEIAAGLGLPQYFGANLDALWDALKGIRAPTAVIIGWRDFAAADPSRAERVLAVLDQRSDRTPPFAVVLV